MKTSLPTPNKEDVARRLTHLSFRYTRKNITARRTEYHCKHRRRFKKCEAKLVVYHACGTKVVVGRHVRDCVILNGLNPEEVDYVGKEKSSGRTEESGEAEHDGERCSRRVAEEYGRGACLVTKNDEAGVAAPQKARDVAGVFPKLTDSGKTVSIINGSIGAIAGVALQRHSVEKAGDLHESMNGDDLIEQGVLANKHDTLTTGAENMGCGQNAYSNVPNSIALEAAQKKVHAIARGSPELTDALLEPTAAIQPTLTGHGSRTTSPNHGRVNRTPCTKFVKDWVENALLQNLSPSSDDAREILDSTHSRCVNEGRSRERTSGRVTAKESPDVMVKYKSQVAKESQRMKECSFTSLPKKRLKSSMGPSSLPAAKDVLLQQVGTLIAQMPLMFEKMDAINEKIEAMESEKANSNNHLQEENARLKYKNALLNREVVQLRQFLGQKRQGKQMTTGYTII